MANTLNNKFIYSMLLAFLLISILPFVSSAPPVTTIQQFSEGYVIEGQPIEILEQNKDFTYNFFVYNISNGVLIDSSTISCNFYLANNYGELLFNGVPSTTDGYFYINIDGGNFSTVGHYPYGIGCNSSNLGGASVNYFEVTPNGLELTVGRAIVDIGLLAILLIFLLISIYLFMENNNLLAKVGSIGFGYLMLIAINFVAWNMANDFLLSAPFISSMFRIIFFVLIAGTFPLLIGAFAWYVLMLFKIKEIENLMTKGFSYDEAERRTSRRNK